MKTTLKIIFSLFVILSVNKISANTPPSSDGNSPDTVVSNLLDSTWRYRTENPIKALNFGNDALKIIDQNNLISIKPKALNFIGVIHRKIGNLEISFNYFSKALSLASTLNDSLQIGYTYTNLTDYYIQKASYSLALEKVLISYKIFENLGNKRGMSYCLNYLGEIYIRYEMYDKALNYLNKSAELRKDIKDLRGYANAVTNIGFIHFKRNDFQKAQKIYFNTIKVNKEIGYTKGNSRILSLLSDINFKKRLYNKAVKNLDGALKIDYKIANKNGIITNLNKLGYTFLKLEMYKNSKDSLMKALRLAKEFGFLDQEMIAYSHLSDYFFSINNFKSSLKAKEKYIALKDSIYSYENIGRFADLQTLFETNKKETENKILKQQIEFEKRIYRYVIIIAVIILLAIIGFVLLLVSKNREKNKANILLKELNDSKDKFFSIIAHDLKSPFQGLLGYTDILKNELDELTADELRESISSLHQITRNVYALLEGLLEWSRVQSGRIEYSPSNFYLKEEVEKVINLNRENAENKSVTIISKINNNISVFADRDMVNTVLRNLIANAIKFSNRESSVIIEAEKKNNFIQISVTDNGIGMSEEILDNLFRIDFHHTSLGTEGEEGTGVGLILCKDLVEKNKGKIWAESKLKSGSKFIFTLPSKDSDYE